MFNNTKNLGKNLEIIVEKGTRKLGFIRQTRENAFNLLSKLLQNPYFQDVIVSELDRRDFSTYRLILHKRDGSTCYLKDLNKDFPDHHNAIYCGLNLRRVYEALTLISYGVLHDVFTTKFDVSYRRGIYHPSHLEESADVYFLCKGFDYLVKPDEISSLTNDILIAYNKLLDCIINNNNAECFGLFLEACSPNNCNEQKQKVEMIINERGLNSLERMKKK